MWISMYLPVIYSLRICNRDARNIFTIDTVAGYSAPPISPGHISHNNSQKTVISSPYAWATAVLYEYEAFYLKNYCTLCDIVLYCNAMYRVFSTSVSNIAGVDILLFISFCDYSLQAVEYLLDDVYCTRDHFIAHYNDIIMGAITNILRSGLLKCQVLWSYASSCTITTTINEWLGITWYNNGSNRYLYTVARQCTSINDVILVYGL